MHTDLWDDIYRKLVTELGRRPTNNEVQARMLEVTFGGQKMPQYNIHWIEYNNINVTVEAASEKEAKEKWSNGEYDSLNVQTDIPDGLTITQEE